MKKLIALLPVAVLMVIGCSTEVESVNSTPTSNPVASDSVPADNTGGTALTFVSLKVPNMH